MASSRARLHTRAVAVAAIPEEGKPARSYSSTRSKSSPAAPSPKPEKKEVKVQFEELAVGKSFKGVVVRHPAPDSPGHKAGSRASLTRPPRQNNLATYGAFIDIGAASNGLAHISQLSVSEGAALAAAEPQSSSRPHPLLRRRRSLWATSAPS